MPHKRAKHSVRAADRKAKGTDLPPKAIDAELRDMPKGAMRILNAAKVQEDYNRRKKEKQKAEREKALAAAGKTANDDQATAASLRIRPGEKLSEFSRRVETTMASDVQASFRATRESARKKRKRAGADADEHDAAKDDKARPASAKSKPELDKKTLEDQRREMENRMRGDRDWQKASQRKRVNDVVQAPPSLTKAPRGQSQEALRRKAELKAILAGGTGEDADLSTGSKARVPESIQQIMAVRRKVELEDEREKAVKAYREAKEKRIQDNERRKVMQAK